MVRAGSGQTGAHLAGGRRRRGGNPRSALRSLGLRFSDQPVLNGLLHYEDLFVVYRPVSAGG